jgi:hypothetical protein
MPETRLTIPEDVKSGIDREAEADERTYKAELVVLLREALTARDRKAARRA